MDLHVDRSSDLPVYRQIADQIRGLIAAGTLPAGFRLPPERRLADGLGVNRSTVLAAYRELKGDDLVSAHVGRGTVVLPARSRPPEARQPSVPWGHLFRQVGPRVQDPLVRDLLALAQRPDAVVLSIGLPAPELMPTEPLRAILDRLLCESGEMVLGHCPTEGVTSLRESISQLMTARGICCDPAEVMVVSGSQQGLDLAARVLVDPGDVVVVEEPSFFGALQVFRAAQARLVGVPVDEQGMRTDVLAGLLERLRPKLIYTLPTFQNPSGAVMSLARRRHLLDLAATFQVPVLEDDPYSDMRFDGEPVPSLKALDTHGCVIYLSTFSKVLCPGLRIGWVAAPRPVLRRLVLAKQALDLHSPTLGQHALDRFLRAGLYPPHVRSLRAAYRQRRDAMVAALGSGAPEGLRFQVPQGGFYLWCGLPAETQPARLLAGAAAGGVTYLPGAACFVDEPPGELVRLNFSFCAPPQLEVGVARFLEAIRGARGGGETSPKSLGETQPLV
jgi:DNA-binding transcriptional MocR family regulator